MIRNLLLSSLFYFIASISYAQSSAIPVLIYHQITDEKPPGQTVISRSEFNKHLDFLKAAGYKTVTVNELVSLLKEKKIVHEKIVVLTFDDGWKDHIYATEQLVKRQMAGTFYVVSGFFNKIHYMSDTEVALISLLPNIEIGAHSHTHFMEWEGHLEKIDDRILVGEMLISKILIEKVIGKEVYSYALPFGYFRPFLRASAKQSGFTSMAHVNSESKNINYDNSFIVERVNIDGRCTLEEFKNIVKTGKNKECQ